MTFTWILLALTILLLILTVTPLSRRKEWWIRAWEFPRLQFATAALLLFAASLFQLNAGQPLTWLPAVIALGCLGRQVARISHFTRLWPVEVPRTAQPDPDRTLKLIIANVQMANRETQRLIRLVEEEAPDMLLTLETNAYWGEKLSVLKPRYPHVVEKPLENTFGMHFYSRFPILKADIQYLVEADIPSFSLQVRMPQGTTLQLYCVHPVPPCPGQNEDSTERDLELTMVGRKAADSPHPVIVAGDLNDVAWSRTTRRFREISGLLDPRVGRGLFNTFHARIPIARWPLDHVFHSAHFRLVRLERLPPIGSDHFPILIALELKNGAASG